MYFKSIFENTYTVETNNFNEPLLNNYKKEHKHKIEWTDPLYNSFRHNKPPKRIEKKYDTR